MQRVTCLPNVVRILLPREHRCGELEVLVRKRWQGGIRRPAQPLQHAQQAEERKCHAGRRARSAAAGPMVVVVVGAHEGGRLPILHVWRVVVVVVPSCIAANKQGLLLSRRHGCMRLDHLPQWWVHCLGRCLGEWPGRVSAWPCSKHHAASTMRQPSRLSYVPPMAPLCGKGTGRASTRTRLSVYAKHAKSLLKAQRH